MDFADDTLLLYADFGVSVTHTPAAGGASTTALAIHDLPGVVLYDGGLAATDHTLRYPTASFPAVARGGGAVALGPASDRAAGWRTAHFWR